MALKICNFKGLGDSPGNLFLHNKLAQYSFFISHRNSGRVWMGSSPASYNVNWGCLVVICWQLADVEGSRWLKSHT